MELQQAKKLAAENDEFDKGVAFRDAIVLLRDKGRNLKNYYEMKRIAVENEDYEVAKRLKLQIQHEHEQISVGYGINPTTGQMYEKSKKYQDIKVNFTEPAKSKQYEKTLEDIS